MDCSTLPAPHSEITLSGAMVSLPVSESSVPSRPGKEPAHTQTSCAVAAPAMQQVTVRMLAHRTISRLFICRIHDRLKRNLYRRNPDPKRVTVRVTTLSAMLASGGQPSSQMQRMAASAGCIAAAHQQVNDGFGPETLKRTLWVNVGFNRLTAASSQTASRPQCGRSENRLPCLKPGI